MSKEISSEQDQVIRGIVSGIAAFLCLATMTAGVKILAQNHHVVEIAFYRNLIASAPMLLFVLLRQRYDLLEVRQRRLVTARVVIGYTGLIMTLAAVDYLPLSDATVIFMASTLIIPVLAALILKERTGVYRWAAILIGFCGVFLAAAPTGQVQPLGVLIAFGAASVQASVQIFLRALKRESPFALTFYFLAGSVLLSAVFLPWVANPPALSEWPLFVGIGVAAGLAQYFMASAYKYAPASVVAPFNYTGLLWATGFDIVLWHYMPEWPVFVGGAVIIVSKIFIVHREKLQEKRRKSERA